MGMICTAEKLLAKMVAYKSKAKEKKTKNFR